MSRFFEVLNCHIAITDAGKVIENVVGNSRNGQGGYICFANVHVVVMGHENSAYREALNNALMTVPDGLPLCWTARIKGVGKVEQVLGPEFLPMMMSVKARPRLRHFYYGGRPEVLTSMLDNIRNDYPEAVVVGAESPPFRALSDAEEKSSIERIKAARPDVIWVGLGAPKQELWMCRHCEALKPAVLLGVGAAFDYAAGVAKRPPRWLYRFALGWFYRFLQEPRRLWWRYLRTNTVFGLYFIKTLLTRH